MEKRIVKRYYMGSENNINKLFDIISLIKDEFGNIIIDPIPSDNDEDYCIPICSDGSLIHKISHIEVYQDGTSLSVYRGTIIYD